MKKQIQNLLGGDVRQFGMIATLIAIVLFFQFMSGGTVLTADNLMNVVTGNAYVLILAMGMVLVIIAGHIDLSVGSVAAFVGIVVAKLTTEMGVNPILAALAGLVVGIAVGSWQGFWVAKWGVPAFITTLAGMMIFRGANQLVGKSTTVPVPEFFQTIGAGYMPDILPTFNLPTMILAVLAVAALAWNEFKKYRRAAAVATKDNKPALWAPIVRTVVISAVIIWVMWTFAAGGRPGTGFPIAGVIVVVLALVFNFISKRTIIGRSVYAIGGNRDAAALTGVRVQRTNFAVMCTSSTLAAIAIMVFMGRSTASGPMDGQNWELDAIAACFIGGASVWGGIGTIGGTMVGALVMAFLNNGLTLLGTGTGLTQVIKGLVLLLAVAVDVYSKRQGKRSLIGTFMNARKNQTQIREAEKAIKAGETPPAVPNTDTPLAEAVSDAPNVFDQTPGDAPAKE